MEIIFHSHASKTHFHKKGCATSLILKGRVFGIRKWPIEMEKLQFWIKKIGIHCKESLFIVKYLTYICTYYMNMERNFILIKTF